MIKKYKKKIIAFFMAGAVLITGGALPQDKAAEAAEGKDYGISSPRVEESSEYERGVTTWDKITFGSYYQDAKPQVEPIKWRVLSVDGNNAFLMADEILDVKPYDETYEDVTWETCTLRGWLNNDFYNTAFDEKEKNAVIETAVVNDDNPEHKTEGGNETPDKVYLLSFAEAHNHDYGFGVALEDKSTEPTRQAKCTDYTILNGVYYSNDAEDEDSSEYNASWWLRSPGEDSSHAMAVRWFGACDIDGWGAGYSEHGIRPVLHVDLSSSKLKNAGTVNSEGQVTESGGSVDTVSNPKINGDVTTWDCVYFGNYNQSCKSEKQPLEWRVLSVDGDDAFLLADKILDVKQYHENNDKSVTWATCALRQWLNGEFYNEAFNEEEQEAVKETGVVNDDNPEYGTDGGANTNDRVFLLSIEEAGSIGYGFEDADEYSDTREASCSDYVELKGLSYGCYWLRSPGQINDYLTYAATVLSKIDISGNMMVGAEGIRPALHINLSEASWSKAGEVSADRSYAKPEPTEDPETTTTPKPTQTPTPEPTDTPEPTNSPEPTATPKPTNTPESKPTGTPKPTVAPDALQFYSDNITAAPGRDVEIPIKIKNNTGIMGLGIRFEFDKDTVTPVDNVEHTSLLAGQFNNSIESALRDETDNFKVLWQGTDEMKQDGLLFTLKFHVASDAEGETDIRLTLLEDETYDEQYENVPVACNNVRIKIGNNIPDNPTATPKSTGTPKPTQTLTPKPTGTPKPTQTSTPKPTIAPNVLQFCSDDITAAPGSDVEIPIKIKNNTGIMGLGIRFEFDKNTVTPVDQVEHTNLIVGQFNNSIESALRDGTDNFKVLWQGTDEMKQDGLLFTLKFHVASGAEGETDIRLTLLEDETFDEQYENVPVACNDVRIKIGNNVPDNPTATPKPTGTPEPTPAQTPDVTQKPDTTEQPNVTQKPDTTQKPDATQNPGTQTPVIQNPIIQNPSIQNPAIQTPPDTTQLTAPAKVKLKSVKAAGKKKLIIRWKWVSGQGGFQIQYALNRKFTKGKKTANVSKDTAEKIISKLKSKKKYYVRVRAYKTVSGKKAYGKWSNVKKCKVK